MKPINKYRKSNHFNLTSVDVERITRCADYVKNILEEDMVALVPTPCEDDSKNLFTVRTIARDGAMYDRLVNVPSFGRCNTEELLELLQPRNSSLNNVK